MSKALTPRGLSKDDAAQYAGCDSLSAFSDWIRRGIMPGPIPGTHKWDRKVLNLVCRKPLDRDLFPNPNAPPPLGYIYFVFNGTDTKIGYTMNFRRRLAGLQTGSPTRLVPLIVFHALRSQEPVMHDWLDEIRLEGEWFAHGPVIMKTVKLIRSLGMDCL